ncbi:NADH-quinone oxidoreductase subunit C [Nocardioides pocheonensis]|uniref:NADH-quinone oxidoreductase subunit C n=1 Tax=Nocardioides pocheonensis TaxID=661485 RepID=A0A3N0GX86_9ACTN|nr:NADH-quinone oxidoreductase subunit C [Nocardioides pocheonensis]RNM16806.1 NADH-quinone oxidoreductase subunit C [Nocardioides pocheonensis]
MDAVEAHTADTREVIGERRGMFGTQDAGDTSGYGGLRRTVTLPGATPPPYGPSAGSGGPGWMDDVAASLARVTREQGLESSVEKVVVHRGEITFFIRRQDLPAVARLLRDDEALRFEFCAGVSGVHYPGDTGRELHAVYHLLSMTHNRRIRLEVTCPDSDPHIPSVVATYPTNDWHERETFDFFGIVFDGHPGLTRIEMPDDWPGHPQRKDYPLGGIPVEYKGGTVPPPDQRRAYS